ncbi:MAG: FAD-dependent oxidoreductase [Sulfolobales archaeon]
MVVGAGVVGLSTAYHLKHLNPKLRVCVLDKASGPGMGDTAKSAGMFRVFFSSYTNFILAKTSIEFFENVQFKEGYDLGMRYVGYLFLVGEKEKEKFRNAIENAERLGGSYRYVDPRDLERIGIRTRVSDDEEARFMGLEDIEYGIFIPRAGMIEPDRIVAYYEDGFRRLGGEIFYETTVRRIVLGARNSLGLDREPFAWQDIIARGVETDKGFIEAENIIIAAGSWSYTLLEPIGIPAVSRPKKRQIFVARPVNKDLLQYFNIDLFNKEGVMPYTILPKGVYVKTHPIERTFWIGLSDDLGRAFKLEEDPVPEDDFYRYSIYPVLSTYLPAFRDVIYETAWSGHYDINPIDGQPIIDRFSNIIISVGTSGSGIMKSDAIGRITASLALELKEAELYGGIRISTDVYKLRERKIEPERLIL